MRTINSSEKRTIRYAAIGLAIYLGLFGGFKAWQRLSGYRADYLQMVDSARLLKLSVEDDAAKADAAKKLMQEFQLDPARLSTNSVVAGASAAIQAAAQSGGFGLGTIRESPGRGSARELAVIEFEGSGQVSAVMALLHRLPLLGYPIVIDSVQITPDAQQPDRIRLNATVNVLNFEQWKKPEATHA